MGDSYQVAVVFVADFSDRIASLANSCDVWIVRTAENEAAVNGLRAKGFSRYSLTLFDVGGTDPVADAVVDIDLHHGEASGGTIAGVRVFGADPTPGSETELARIGLSRIERVADGFVALPR